MMKKCLAIICVLVIGLTTACANRLSGYTEISYVDYLQKIDNGDTFPLVIGSETCSACGVFKGTMSTFIKKYQIEVFFIDVSKVNEEEYNLLKSEISFDGTPTTVFIESGKLTSFYNRIDGSAGLSDVKDYFKRNKYID